MEIHVFTSIKVAFMHDPVHELFDNYGDLFRTYECNIHVYVFVTQAKEDVVLLSEIKINPLILFCKKN